MAGTVKVKCTNTRCEEHDTVKEATAGVEAGDNVMVIFGRFSCMVCGSDMLLVH